MKKKILSAAVSAVLVGGIGVETASADSVFAPLFDTREGRNTVISLVTKTDPELDEDVDVGDAITPAPNWIYLYKDPDEPRLPCLHADFQGSQTPNDLGTYDLAAGETLFDDTTSEGGFIAPGLSGVLAISTGGDIVEGDDEPRAEGTLSGEGILVDSVFGAVLAYRMANNPDSQTEEGFDAISFGSPNSISADLLGDPVAEAPVAIWHPVDILATSWRLIAMEENMFELPVPDLTLEVAFAGGTGNIGFLYDRDELRISTSGSVPFNCIANATLEDFVDPGALDAVANGGWAHILIVEEEPDGDDPVEPAVENKGLLVYKAESAGGIGILTSENRIDF